jgi:hypothetical protein
MWTGFTTTSAPNSSVVPWAKPAFAPPPANHVVYQRWLWSRPTLPLFLSLLTFPLDPQHGSDLVPLGLHPIQFRLPGTLVGRRPHGGDRPRHFAPVRRPIPRLLAQALLAQRHQLRLRTAGIEPREALLHVPLRRLQPRRLDRTRRERRLPGQDHGQNRTQAEDV